MWTEWRGVNTVKREQERSFEIIKGWCWTVGDFFSNAGCMESNGAGA